MEAIEGVTDHKISLESHSEMSQFKVKDSRDLLVQEAIEEQYESQCSKQHIICIKIYYCVNKILFIYSYQ